MPFYSIDWSRYSNYTDARGAVDASTTINEITRIILKIWKYSGCWFNYKLPKNYRWLNILHRLVLLILLLCVLSAATVSFRYLSIPLQLNAITVSRITLTLIYWQCVACTASIFYWQTKKRFRKFGKLLNAATMGIGIMREKEHLRHIQYGLLLGFGIWAFSITLYHSLGIYPPPAQFTILYPWTTLLWIKDLQPLSLLFIIYAAFNWFLAHTLLINYYAFLLAEITSLNVDSKGDSNLYQLAVLKHYNLIYHRLMHVNRHLNASFAPLLTLTTFCNYLTCVMYTMLFYNSYNILDTTQFIIGSITMTMAGIYLIAFTVLAVKLRKQGKYFFDAVHDVVAMDWHLDNEYHSIASSNAIYGKPVTFGLAFGTSWTVTGRLLMKILCITTIVIILFLFR